MLAIKLDLLNDVDYSPTIEQKIQFIDANTMEAELNQFKQDLGDAVLNLFCDAEPTFYTTLGAMIDKKWEAKFYGS